MIPSFSALAASVADELVSQPALFPVECHGRLPVTRRGTYSGERVTQDEERVLTVCALRLLGLSDREIARRVQCARESIPLLIEEGERRGLVRPLKDRLVAALGHLSEDAIAASRELVSAVRSKEISEVQVQALRALGPMVGISVEKLQLLTGQATEIVEQRSGPTREEFLARWKAESVDAEVVSGMSSDSESDGSRHISAVSAPVDHPPTLTTTTEAQSGAQVDPAAAGLHMVELETIRPGRGGEGVESRAVPMDGDDSSGSQNFEQRGITPGAIP